MYKPFIYPIIPRPVPVNTEYVKGKLHIEGNMEHNYVRFRFCFKEPAETAPVSITVEAEGKVYGFCCAILDYANNEAKTCSFHPEFFIGKKFNIANIEPLVKFNI